MGIMFKFILALAGIITAQAVVGGNDERELQSTGIWKYTARGNIVYLKMCWDAQRNMRGLQIKRNGASTKTFGSISGMRCKAHSLAKTDCWIRGSMRRLVVAFNISDCKLGQEEITITSMPKLLTPSMLSLDHLKIRTLPSDLTV